MSDDGLTQNDPDTIAVSELGARIWAELRTLRWNSDRLRNTPVEDWNVILETTMSVIAGNAGKRIVDDGLHR